MMMMSALSYDRRHKFRIASRSFGQLHNPNLGIYRHGYMAMGMTAAQVAGSKTKVKHA